MMDRAILFIGLIAIAFCGSVSGGIDKTIKQQKGRTVVLECPIDGEACGDLHSLNWFKGDTRIAVILGGVNVSSVIPEYSERVKLEESPYRLTLNDLRISDEDVYICDTTFYIPQESCDATRGYRTEVIVLEHPPPVPPSDILVLDEKNDKITNGSIIGPVEEGKTLTAICKVEKTRPQPSMAWYRGNKRLTTHSPSYDEDEDGLFTATLELSLVLSRQDLDNDIECRVESAALDDIYKSLIKLDLQVRPTGIQLEGVGHHTTQGTLTTLSCKVAGARPSANISWTNGTEIIDPNENGDGVDIRLYHQLQKDGTYDTESQLIFTASRFENDITFGCHATNIVIKRNNEKPIHAEIPLEVLYPPVVEVLEDDITVNEHKKTTLTCEFIANPASLTGVRWYKNGEPIKINKSGHYEGGSPDHVPLTILNAHRDDRGNYTCELTNSIGSGNSTVQIQLDVLYVPSVEVIMLPKGPVKENDEVNVTLLCNITDANPWALTKVRWFANSTLLKELPDCSNQNNNSEDLCNIDPSKLLLESVGRGFAYNYSCEGFNTAGWGNRSQEVELVVFHEPGPARLTYYPLTVVKKQSVTFSCTVDVLGVPEATQYRWFRGGQGPLIDVYKKDWTIELVDLDSRTNFSCLAYNDGGKGEQATVTLDVKAPPFFIKNLLPYTGVLFSTKNASLTCRVECVPRCKINWFKDGVGIYANDTSKYHIYEEYLKENPATGDFESVLSILHFNMSAWPNQQFDMHYDNANYSCVASENEVGAGVRSATYFSIEYPPENTTVSNEIVNVTENTIPARVLCNSKANPEPSYEWTLEEKSLAQGNALIINKPMLRNESGHYKCIAFNKHGSSEATTFVNVQYKPHCDIDRKMIDDQDTLICTAYGNPDEFGFVWSIKTENDSVEVSSGSIDGDKAFLVLNDDFTITRTYRCVANNTIGEGHMCEIEVAVRPKRQLAWWQRWDRTTLIIVIAAVSAILLAVIIICCIIICICRRRRRQDKYTPNREFMKAVIKPSKKTTEKLKQAYKISSSTTPIKSTATAIEIDEIKPLATSSPCKSISTKIYEEQNESDLRKESLISTSSIPLSSPTSISNVSNDIPPKLPKRNIPPRPPPPKTTVNQISAGTKNSIANNSHLDAINSSINLTNELLPRCRSNNSATNTNFQRKGKNNFGTSTITSPTTSSSIATIALVNQCELASDEEYEDDTISITKSPIGGVISRKGNKNDQQSTINNNGCSQNNNSNTNNTIGGYNLPSPRNIGGNLFEKIFGEIFSKRNFNKNNNHNDDLNSLNSERSENRLLRYFGMSKVFKRQRLQRNDSCSSSNPFTVEHRLKGLRSSGSVVTYKKTPVLERAAQNQQINKFESTEQPISIDDNYALIELNEHDSLTSQRSGMKLHEKIHDKSSTLADPLTEPGEYENLPFHGLQQAPNKFTTTPINFNNNTNVVRVAPRPKLTQTNNHHQKNLDQFHQIFNQQQLQQQNITTNNQNNYHQKSIQFPNQNQHQSQQQLHYQIQQQYSPADCYTNSLKLIQNKTKTKNLNYGSSTLKLEKRKPIVGGTIDNNLQDITRVTTDRFPTSYTEYFQQQKFSDIISSDNQNNLIDRTTLNPNYPYTVVENGIITPTSTTTQLAPQSSTSSSSVSSSRIVFNNSNSTNPFLATNFRKFQISTGTRPGCGTITANHRKKHHSNNSSNNSIIGSGEKKFYSLKALKNKNNLSFSSIKPSALLSNSNNSNSNNKCKRHHSFAGGSFADVINGIDTNNSIDITANNLPYTMQPKIKFYEPPTYENLTDSIQIHESPSENLIQQQTSDINTQTHLKQQQQPQQQLINTSKTKTSNKQNNQTVTTGSSTSSSSKLSNSINLSTSSTTSSVVGGIGNQYNIIQKQNQQKHQHHQTQRQKMNDDNTKKHLMEPERMSIYRSDSGISNSSYECVTPIAPPRQYNLLDDDIIDTTICINNKNDNDDNDIDNDIINNHHHFGDAIDKCNPDVTKTNRIDKLYNSAINSTTSTTSTNLSSYNNSINNRKLLENDFDRLHNDTNNSTYNNSLLNPELSHLYLNNPNKSQYTSNSTNQKNSIADTINVVNTNNDFTTTASNIINATNKTNNIMHDGLSVKCQNKKNDQHEQRQHNQKKPITITTSNTSINTIDNSRSNIIINSSNKIGSKRRTNTASPLANSSYNGTANIVGHERSINTNPFLVTSPSTTSSSSSSGCISNNSINDKGSSSFFSSTSSQSDEFKSSSTISPSSTSSFASTVREGFTSSCDGIQASSSITPISSINKYKKLKSSQIQYQPNESYIESITEKENSDAESSIITSKSLNAKYQLKNRIINNDFQQKEKSSSSLSLSIKDIVTQNETTSNRLLSNDILNTKHATQINNKFYEMIKNRYPGYITKSIKQIPLRKHHSFHFQQYYPNPNTMLGQLKLHQIQKEQAKAAAVALQTSSFDSTILRDASNIKNIYKQVGGPLIYRPFLNENTAFKPISPVNRTKFSTTFPTTNYLSDSESNCYRYQYNSNATETEEESLNFERIHNRYPIVSLKRHASNIESYDSKRYSTYYENSRENSPCTEEKIISEQAHNQMNFIENKENHHSLSELEDDDDNDRDDDEIFMQHDDDANSSASNSTIVGKRLIYVDFDIVSTTKSDNNCYQSNQHENENYKSNEFNNETPNNEEQSINSNDNYCDNNQQNNVDNCEKNYYLKKNSSNDQELSKIKSKSDDLFHKNSIQNKKSTIKLIKSSLENKDETDQENKLKSNEIEKIQKDEINKEVDEEVEDICETSSITGIILAKPPTKRNTQYATLKYNEVKI
ncbi:putative uncharacterized protein DDB_G0282133 isoform X3 [Condylostylus longicornis]|uniref:putative uncharacterized protein DDB_G0282133 isoform X3 n=1 Tax=Condylostylus longicornis TaxID=2530218 RepID=UPI00244DC2FE|nr:putative uncharacterized protein DDB_G0282133 isoform X3 [Condylostylus longicornis]